MEGRIKPLGELQAPGEFTREAVRILRALDANGQDPLVLGYHPIAKRNPFHGLLYRSSREAGIGTVPVVREDTFGEMGDLARAGQPVLLHLHWLNRVLGGCASVKDAERERTAFLGSLDRFRDAGGRLAWTVHNILPHHTAFEQEEARLSQDVIDRADVVHVMARDTAALVAPYYTIPPAKTLVVPHPSYLGAYEDYVTRDEARHALGLWPDEIVYVLLGTIRPYKGLAELLAAWPAVRAGDQRRRLVIAGAASDEPEVGALLEQAALDPGVSLFEGFVEPSDVQLFLRAADVAVLPYTRALNSGALMLAVTFGLPVVVPAGGGLADIADDRFVRTFDADADGALTDALASIDGLLTPGARAAAEEAAQRLAPGPQSRALALGLREHLARRG